jgi:hypothetical protein
MSKFDTIFKKIEENIGMAPTNPSTPIQKPTQPVTGQVTPEQLKQTIQTLAQAVGVDANELQKFIDTHKKPASTNQAQSTVPAA